MADVSSTLANISSTESSNAPSGATAVGTGLDENLRMIEALLGAYRDATGWSGLLLSSVAGNNTITGSVASQGSCSVAPSAYASGMRFCFIPANTTTGSVTLNVGSLGAKNVFYDGHTLVGGELSPASPAFVQYDGTQFNLISPIFTDRLTEDTSPDVFNDYIQTYDASATGFKKVKPSNLTGLVKLNSGDVSNAGTLDIVMTSYTSYKDKLLILSAFIPATDAAVLQMRVSTDGGSNYDAGVSDYGWAGIQINLAAVTANSETNASRIMLTDTLTGVGNGTDEGANCNILMYSTTNTALKPRFQIDTTYLTTGTVQSVRNVISGHRQAAQDTDAVRIFFSSGNIASGHWALYGYA